jgi:hypothetical protein
MSDDFVKIGSHTLSPRPSKEELTFPEDESKLGLYWFHMYWNKYHDCVELEARVKELEDSLNWAAVWLPDHVLKPMENVLKRRKR